MPIQLNNPLLDQHFQTNPSFSPEQILLDHIRSPPPFFTQLSRLFPTATISSVHQNMWKLTRHGFSYTLVFYVHTEHDSNLSKQKVEMFEKEILEKPFTHGICLSQYMGIETRNNYSLRRPSSLHLCLYLHRCKNDEEKVKGMIEWMDEMLGEMDILGTRSTEIVTALKKEYETFHTQREILQQYAKDIYTTTTQKIMALRLPVMEKEFHLNELEQFQGMKCEFCSFVAPTTKSLSAHLRKSICKQMKETQLIELNKKRKI